MRVHSLFNVYENLITQKSQPHFNLMVKAVSRIRASSLTPSNLAAPTSELLTRWADKWLLVTVVELVWLRVYAGN